MRLVLASPVALGPSVSTTSVSALSPTAIPLLLCDAWSIDRESDDLGLGIVWHSRLYGAGAIDEADLHGTVIK